MFIGLAALLPLIGAASIASAQDRKAAPAAAIPRAADGHPDFTGVWQGGSTVPGTWEEANRGTGLGGTGTDANAPVLPSSNDRPADREPAPYQPWAAKKVLESFNRRGIDDPTARCLPGGIPRLAILGLFPIQIVQTPQQILIIYEYMNVVRVIPFASKHHDDAEPTYMGDSIARWDGNTLVVDVTDFNDKTWLAGTGTFHSDRLHIVERYTRISKDRINYDVTMEDPSVFTKPWNIHSSMMLREGTRIREYVCAENNEDVINYEKLLKDESLFRRK